MTAANADVKGIMAEDIRTPRQLRTGVPVGLLEELTAGSAHEIRLDDVARARQHADDRAYDDGAVIEEIASQLLALSAP